MLSNPSRNLQSFPRRVYEMPKGIVAGMIPIREADTIILALPYSPADSIVPHKRQH